MTRRAFQYLLAPGLFQCKNLLAEGAEDAKPILEKVADAYQSLRTYYFEGKTISETTIGGKTSRTELGFVVAFEAPRKFRLEFRYQTAGNWLRVSDGQSLMEHRSLTKETQKTPATENAILTLKSSPLYNFERLCQTAGNPRMLRSEMIDVDGKRLDCHLIQFESHRWESGQGESPEPSMVWVAKGPSLVMREEIHTSTSIGEKHSETKRTTEIANFDINKQLSGNLFSIA